MDCDPHRIMLADDFAVVGHHCGDVQIRYDNSNLILSNTLSIPDLGYNLVSVGRLVAKGILSWFGKTKVTFPLEINGMVMVHGPRHSANGLYRLPFPSFHQRAYIASDPPVNTELSDRGLTHMHMVDLYSAHGHEDGVPQPSKSSEVCRACRLGKYHKLPFLGHFVRSRSVGDVLHSYLVVPLELSFPHKQKYVLTVLGNHSRSRVAGFLQRRLTFSVVPLDSCHKCFNCFVCLLFTDSFSLIAVLRAPFRLIYDAG